MAPAAPSTDAIYDRQIRLWGADAQSKLMAAAVHIVNLSGLTSELAKNMVLAGITVTLIEIGTAPATSGDVASSMFLTSQDVGNSTVAEASQKKLQEMNIHGTVSLSSHPTLSSYISTLQTSPPTVLITSSLPFPSISAIATALPPTASLFATDALGTTACCFSHFTGGTFTCIEEKGKERTNKTVTFPSWEAVRSVTDFGTLATRFGEVDKEFVIWCVFNDVETLGEYGEGEEFVTYAKKYLLEKGLPEDYLGSPSDLLSLLAASTAPAVAPVSAIFGGVLGQEVIKCISGKGEPAMNVLTFSALSGVCKELAVPNSKPVKRK